MRGLDIGDLVFTHKERCHAYIVGVADFDQVPSYSLKQSKAQMEVKKLSKLAWYYDNEISEGGLMGQWDSA